jgi:hypothetical protein
VEHGITCSTSCATVKLLVTESTTQRKRHAGKMRDILELTRGQVVQHDDLVSLEDEVSARCDPMNPAPPQSTHASVLLVLVRNAAAA